MMIRSAAPTTSPAQGAATSRPALLPIVILALIVIVAVATGIGYAETTGNTTNYACISITHQGNTQKVTTSGLLHYVKSQYYVSCNEGSPLPSSQYTASCLKILPKTILAPIGVGASTEYYYISANGNAITLNGAPTPVNDTEYINTSTISLSVSC
ncbi:MAG TPA: hypothetical protein VGS04_04685, partial [Nitrososphaerales archaeon]|nr:hypothetical protein [Nitrososphaerales archaeon]